MRPRQRMSSDWAALYHGTLQFPTGTCGSRATRHVTQARNYATGCSHQEIQRQGADGGSGLLVTLHCSKLPRDKASISCEGGSRVGRYNQWRTRRAGKGGGGARVPGTLRRGCVKRKENWILFFKGLHLVRGPKRSECLWIFFLKSGSIYFYRTFCT